MAHSLDVKERSFRLWVQGLSVDDIVAQLKRGGIRVNRKSILRWRKNEGWDERKKAVVSEVQKNTEREAADLMAEVLNDTAKLRELVLSQLQAAGPPKSIVGGVQAYVQLCNLLKEIAPAKVVDGDAGEVVRRILDVLFRHPKVGIVIEKYRDEILADIKRELKKTEGSGAGVRGPGTE